MTPVSHRSFQAVWRAERAMLLLILLLGAVLRLWQIESQPGLYRDEAFYGLDAVNVLQGELQLYFPANNGREPLFIYLVALSVKFFGNTPLAIRLASALVGLALIPATYALGCALFNRRVGLLAAALVAFTFWPIALSRIGFRVGTLPLVAALSLACVVFGWRSKRLGWVVLGGALYGLTFYTYLAARFSPAALIAFGFFWYIAHRSTFPAPRWWAAFFAPALLIAAPLGMLTLSQPDLVFGRAGQVTIFSPDIHQGDFAGTLFHNLGATLGMFVVDGDALARHNLPHRPVFDRLMSLAFVAGVILAGWRVVKQRERASALLLIWSAVMLLPTGLAADAPHFLRAAGVLPVALIFPALALEMLWTKARWGRGIVLASLVVSLLITTRDYFVRYLGDPETAYFFESAATDLATQTNTFLDAAAERRVYLDRRLWDSFPSIRFLLAGQADVQVFDSTPPAIDMGAESHTTESHTTESRTAESRIIVWPYADPRVALTNLPSPVMVRAEAGPLHRGDAEAAPYSLFTTYTLTPAPTDWPTPLAIFEGGLILQSAVISSTTAGVRADLLWRTQPDVWRLDGPDYHVFVQWRAGEAVLAQADAPPTQALYPTPWWPGGVAVWDTHGLELPSGEALTPSQLWVGMYVYPTLQRLRLVTGSGDVVAVPVP